MVKSKPAQLKREKRQQSPTIFRQVANHHFCVYYKGNLSRLKKTKSSVVFRGSHFEQEHFYEQFLRQTKHEIQQLALFYFPRWFSRK